MAKEKKNTFIIIGAAIILVVLVAAGIRLQSASAQSPGVSTGKSSDRPPVSESAPANKVAAAYKVGRESIQKEILLTGELRAANSTSITAPDIRSSFSNMVTFLAPEGSQIKKGDRIVEFDDSSLMSSKSEAERALDEAKLNIEKTKADLEAQRCDLLNSVSQAESQLKQDELYGKISKDLLPGNTYQKYQLNLQKSKLALDKAKESLDNFEKSYASQMSLVEISRSQAEINLKKIISDMTLLKIDAPQDGILIYGDNWQNNRKIQPGDTLFHGMEVASLPDLSSMQVVGYVYDTEYSLLAVDMRCSISFDAVPGIEIGGRVVSLTSVASRKSFASTKKVFQAVMQPDKLDVQQLKPGMTARVRAPLVLAKEAAAVPREYLGFDNQGRSYVIKGMEKKTAAQQFVQLGAVGDRFVQVVSGVSVGDTLLPVQR
jgi:multidrug efflux pump subunit AcrA (membrane-fusion protein)